MQSARIRDFDQWFSQSKTDVHNKNYCHVLLIEDVTKRAGTFSDLQAYVKQAHEPARQHLLRPFKESLHPAGSKPMVDPSTGYPEMLDDITLQGYFGEIFSGIIAEHCEHKNSSNWEVPAYLFHTHDVAFQELEKMKQGQPSKRIFGRTGDDCLAFEKDESGKISRVMVCEAKLTQNHNANLIKENHAKLSDGFKVPVHVSRVIEALKYLPEDAYTQSWIGALQEFYFNPSKVERLDLASYACGQKPKTNSTWIDTAKPHPQYSGGRYLVSSEAHLDDVKDLVESVCKIP